MFPDCFHRSTFCSVRHAADKALLSPFRHYTVATMIDLSGSLRKPNNENGEAQRD